MLALTANLLSLLHDGLWQGNELLCASQYLTVLLLSYAGTPLYGSCGYLSQVEPNFVFACIANQLKQCIKSAFSYLEIEVGHRADGTSSNFGAALQSCAV